MSSGQSGGGGSSGGSGAKFLQVKDLEPNQKGFSLVVIVLDVSKPTQTKDGHEVRSVRIADKTGSVNLSVWNEFGAVLREGDILRMTGCFTQIWKNSLQIKIGPKGTITKVGDYLLVFSETPDMSVLSNELLKEIQEQQQKLPAKSAPGSITPSSSGKA